MCVRIIDTASNIVLYIFSAKVFERYKGRGFSRPISKYAKYGGDFDRIYSEGSCDVRYRIISYICCALGPHIIFYKKGKDGSISVDHIWHLNSDH